MSIEYINIVEKTKCTGCFSCYNVCPKECIIMKEDDEGFIYPFVNYEQCVHCDLCISTCPALNTKYNNACNNCYAVTCDSEIQYKSSSGGVFSVIAEHIIDNKGIICGVAFDSNFGCSHTFIEKKEDLYKIRGSKYIQSNIGYVYKEIKRHLQHRQVLFSGTPCQVAGLYNFLSGSNIDNLFTIDIVCHGVPNAKIWNMYLSENFDKKNIQVINFRDKEKGWAVQNITVVIDGIKFFDKKFMDGFVQNLFLRESCGQCQYAKLERTADITLGDFWGIWREDPSMYDHMGVSLVLVNSQKGKSIFNSIKDKFSSCKEENINATKMNYPLFRSTIHHKNRDFFFKKIKETSSFNKSLDASLNYVSIINFWWCNNYGAMCTAYALQEKIKELGYFVKTVNYIPKWFYDTKFKGGISEAFSHEHFDLTALVHTKQDLEKINDHCSTFICGSDQIWRYGVEQLRNWKEFKDYENLCFLSYAHSNKKKIAYAASFACDTYEGPYRNRSFVRYLLNRFQYISVREADGVDVCRNEFGVNATHVLDPVFLHSEKFWSSIADKSSLTIKNHICFYVLDTPSAKKHTLDYIKQKVHGELVDISCGFNEPLENWLYNIKNCRLFVADSFHGCCFAIIFNKPFICFKNTFRGGSRFDSILRQLGLENRILMDHEKIEDRQDLFEDIDYSNVNKILEKEKNVHYPGLLML